MTASFNQSGSSPSRSATLAAARRTESVGAKPASRSRVARRPSKQSAIAAPPTRKISARCLAASSSDANSPNSRRCHRRRAGPESCSAQSAGGDEHAPGAKGRRGLLKRSRVHPAQRRHEPPPAGVSPRLARPRGQRPVVAPSEVLRQRCERSIHLGGTRRRRLVTEPPECDRGTGSGKIM